eukprot:CAMPEP_0197057780 /NCGR_PEP_ID=MMETSP1384-20130603/100644_1 /TAXON_ID=29189 /ORGANISM="Ammonia sp." /LENGTH=403 /DNA_ID=CAMNT_0042492307 /DNA_START=308 /DNA_END=1519 /DNA_ORIENTATION=-
MYKDEKFPPNSRSLACADNKQEFKVVGESTQDIIKKVEWKRASELCESGKMYLFQDGVAASDVVQGALGDCWLMAALAALAEFPGAIENAFLSMEVSSRGKYWFRLYDARVGKRKRVYFCIDDFIPCYKDSDQPIFSRPKGNEMWVLLIEKAFAKFCGGYSELKGGHTMWAMQCITGDHVFRLEYDYDGNEQLWSRWDFEYLEAKSTNPRRDKSWKDSNERFDNDKIWALLLQYDENDALISASVTSRNEQKNEDIGIVSGHAYTIRHVVSVSGFRLLCLRNPWGSFEWKGDWSDDSKLWQTHSDVARKLDFKPGDDGMFWMEYNDFLGIYDVIEICDRSTIRNLHLDVKEDQGCSGVVKGCCVGCGEFWCCCQGLSKIYFGRVSSNETREVNECCSCLKQRE